MLSLWFPSPPLWTPQAEKSVRRVLRLAASRPSPGASRRREERLVEAPASEETFATLASDVLAGAHGFGGNDFKIPLTRRTLRAVMIEANLT